MVMCQERSRIRGPNEVEDQAEAGRTGDGSQRLDPESQLWLPVGMCSTNAWIPGPHSGSVTLESWRSPGTGTR